MPVQDWFATWFNSKYYHTLYKDRNLQEAEVFVDTLVSHLALPHGARALDLACGKGRHSLHLKQKGFEVIGVDLSDESIAEAKLHEQDGLDFLSTICARCIGMNTLIWSLISLPVLVISIIRKTTNKPFLRLRMH
jgi:cyclopropane fatty-acyl-phospholipid synthase-like methyltransferase